MKKLLLTPIILFSLMAAKGQEADKSYPPTRQDNTIDDYFGVKVPDPYRWLEDDRSAETAKWVKSQQEFTNNYLEKIPMREHWKKRLTELWNYEKYSLPSREGAYLYYFKNDGLQPQSVLYRQAPNGQEEIFLDPNKFSQDGTTSLAGISFSQDGAYCAYQISEGGSDWRKVIILSTNDKKKIDDTLRNVKFSSIAWKGNDGFYYSSYDKPKDGSMLSGKTQAHKLYYHKLGTSQKNDALIFGDEETPRRYVSAEVTEDGNFLIIYAANTTHGNELYIQNLTMQRAPLIQVINDFEHEHHVVCNEGEQLYILTSLGAANKRLVRTTPDRPQPENWVEVIRETEFPLSVTTVGGRLFAHYIKDAVAEVYEYDFNGNMLRKVDLPGLGSVSGFSGKRSDEEIYYAFTSYIYPTTIFKYKPHEGASEVYKKPNLKFNTSQFESKQLFYESKDGTRIPMMITYKKGMDRNGTNPTLLYGYGGFNISLTPAFSVSNIAFMEAGGIYAVANIRGGGEYGFEWHVNGTKMKKQNVFDDFIYAAQFLIDQQYTSPEYLAIAGGSNGGLLVGACMTQRPELFRVCFPAVGVLDMLRYHKFTAGAGWAFDYGTSDDSKEMFEYLYSYSPVHNVKKGTCYPPTMIFTADHDDRVVPAHSFKFAAALQNIQECGNPILIRIDNKAGHGAGKPTEMIIAEHADKWAFMFHQMGLDYSAILENIIAEGDVPRAEPSGEKKMTEKMDGELRNEEIKAMEEQREIQKAIEAERKATESNKRRRR